MTSPALLLLAPLLAVTFGYEPSADSDEGYDYTVQVEPELFERMKAGEADAIEANIPAEVAPIRRIRVVVGTDTLAKKLRPNTVLRTTYRQDLDSPASPSIDLLAQTGPAGGFGRDSTGFNSGSTRSTPQPTNNTTLPPVVPTNPQPTSIPTTPSTTNPNYTNPNYWTGTQPTTTPSAGTQPTSSFDLQRQLDAGFQSANNTINNAADSMRAGIDQTIQNTQNAFTGSTTGLQPLPPVVNSTSPQWTNTNTTTPYRAGEQSVLANQPNTTQPTITNINNTPQETQQQYYERMRLEEQFRQEQAAMQARSNANTSSQFPPQPALQLQPPRQESDVVVPFVNRSQLNTVDNRSTLDAPAITSTSNSFGNNNPAANSGLTGFGGPYDRALDPPSGFGPPLTNIGNSGTLASNTGTTQSSNRLNTESWSPGAQQSNLSGATVEAAKSSNLPSVVLAWALALGAAALNMFQWLNIVDMRNKYRVALRRTSPNFARSMAA